MVRQLNAKIQVAMEQEMTPYSSEMFLRKQGGATKSSNTMKTKMQTDKLQHTFQEEREKNDSNVSAFVRQTQSDKRQQSSRSANRIRLHVYDLVADSTVVPLFGVFEFPVGQIFNALNSGLHTLGTGAYHVGIEVNGVEYAFGANEYEKITGVYTSAPTCAAGYQYRTTIDFGERKPLISGKSSLDGRQLVHSMSHEYMGQDYDLLRKNCCTFAHDACLRLGIEEQEIPTWFRNLADAGAVTQDAATCTMEPLSDFFSSEEQMSIGNV